MTLYAINADTMGISQYAGVSPVALVEHLEVQYLVTATQLNELTGSDDNSTDIDVVVQTGYLNLDTSASKNVPICYLHILTDGGLLLTVTSSSLGSQTSREYSIPTTYNSTDDYDIRRIQLDRSRIGMWWLFQLENVDGSSFDLRGMEISVVELVRRV